MHRGHDNLSDLLRFLGCPHATWLDLNARDTPLERATDDPQMAPIQDHEHAHTRAFLEHLKTSHTVTEIPGTSP